MAKKQQETAPIEPLEAGDYLERVRENLAHVVNTEGASTVARYTDVSRDGLYKIIKGERVPGLDTFAALAVYLDIDPAMWFLEPATFKKALLPAEERNRFFAEPRRLRSVSSPSGRMASGGNISSTVAKRTLHIWRIDQPLRRAG